MGLLSGDIIKRLRDNRKSDDPVPVVKLHAPYNPSALVWLLAAQDTEDKDKFLCLADVGIGQPEVGFVHIRTLEDYDNRGIPIVVDSSAVLDKRLSEYANIARREGKIVV